MNKQPRLMSLTTKYEEDLRGTEVPFSDYPRPQMRRDSYMCLNGKWKFRIEDEKSGEASYDGDIMVPFVPESRISGVERAVNKNDCLIYERCFMLKETFIKERVVLHFGACDQYAWVYVNDRLVGENVGGYLAFSFDITEYIYTGENKIKVVAKDPMCIDLPYGKQTNKRGGMWYTKISGIWQTVWIESVPADYIESIKVTPDLVGVDIDVAGGDEDKTLYFQGRKYRFSGNHFRLEVEEPILWTPNNPHLYDFKIESGEDKVSSYFGLRTVSIGEHAGKSVILLNDEPMFFHGLLDQGYFSDGIFLPASEQGFVDDILQMKKCGFNMLRKHIKLEPDLFYYYCDKYGMLVFQDMINSGKYSFLIDTALPTVFLKRGVSHRANKVRRAEFEKTCDGIIKQLYNHPSVVYYTIFNEGWGQFDADEYYEKFKSMDETRIYDSTSGWFKEKLSDVESEHVYFKSVKLKPVKGRPLVLSEFGGYSCKIEGHAYNIDKTYGYKYFDDRNDFEDALVSLYENEILPAIENGLCATVLTQVSDVEDETNGLLTYDRQVLKVSSEKMKALASLLFEKYSEIN